MAILPLVAVAVDIDGVVARVGEDTILRSDVINEMRRIGCEDGSRYREIRNEMIDRRLIIQAAAAAKMTMQEWVVDNRVREIIQKGFEGDRNKLIETLGRQKVSFPEWRAKMKEDLIVNAMRWNVVDKNVSASPAAMKKEYEEHRERYAKDHKVSVSVITLKPEEQSRRQEISAKLKTKTFEELGAQKHENIVPGEFFNAELVKEIEKMPKGTISHWIEQDGWSVLLRKDDETHGRNLSFEEAYDEIEANVKEAEAKRLYTEWLGRLRAETYVKVFD